MFKLVKYTGLIFLMISAFLLVSFATSAEDDLKKGCSGRISGKILSPNINAGMLDFDSHPGVGIEGTGSSDGSILGFENVVAPADRELAACTELDGDDFSLNAEGEIDISKDKFLMKGYVWNTNVGFINFYCGSDGDDIAGNNCGSNDYGVKISEADAEGKRTLSGYAWNPIFGYLNFDDGNVYRDGQGMLHGYAWSEVGVWMSFEGLKMGLPGDVVEELPIFDEGKWCENGVGKRICVEVGQADDVGVDKDFGFGVGMESLKGVKVADGKDGYSVRIYFSDTETDMPLNIEDLDKLRLAFNWVDTVKKDQRIENVNGADADFSDVQTPWTSGQGAVTYKPIQVSKANFESYFKKVKDGEYVLKNKIASYAPTSEVNVSYTTSTKPPYAVRNDVFLTDVFDGKSPVENQLILESITYQLMYAGETYKGTIHANGTIGLPLRFRPAIYLETLFANGYQDTVDALRGIPITFTLGLKKADSSLVDSFVKSVGSDLLTLALSLEKNDASGCGDGLDFSFYSADNATLDGTKKQVYSEDVPENLSAVVGLSGVNCSLNCDEIEDEAEKSVCESQVEQCEACSLAGNAGIYSTIHYVADGKDVYYYSNKLPRLASVVVNPVAVIHGNIYAPKAFSPSAAQKTQATGNVSIDVVRNAVNENIKTSLKNLDWNPSTSGDKGACVVDSLIFEDFEPKSMGGEDCDEKAQYVFDSIEKNGQTYNYAYFNNSDVELDLVSEKWEGNWTVIVEGGRVFIDDDIYSEASDVDRLALIVMRASDDDAHCYDSNVYVDKGVKNIQANLAADCSLFSYDSSKPDSIIEGGGESLWTGLPNWKGESLWTGLPNWNSFEEMTEALGTQLFWEGSIAGRMTVGGADLDAEGLEYLLLGTGRTVGFSQAERFLAQLYDLNYLRLFKLKLELSEDGLPIDQLCGKALTVEDMLKINEKKATSIADLDNPMDYFSMGVFNNGKECDGINPLNQYKKLQQNCLGGLDATMCSGDLVVLTEDESKLSKGLDHNEDFEPVYIFYRPPDSFVFEKTGRTTTY